MLRVVRRDLLAAIFYCTHFSVLCTVLFTIRLRDKFLGRPEFPAVLCVTALSFFSFLHFQRDISELPRLKLCHMIGSMFNFVIQVQKVGGPPPKKIGGGGLKQLFGRPYFGP